MCIRDSKESVYKVSDWNEKIEFNQVNRKKNKKKQYVHFKMSFDHPINNLLLGKREFNNYKINKTDEKYNINNDTNNKTIILNGKRKFLKK